jgi:hypothetical protein
MAPQSSQPQEFSADTSTDAPGAEAWPAPAPAPIGGAQFAPEDTWMTFGLDGGTEDDRTVTVVFSRPEEDSTDFPGEPFTPVFPGR